MNKRTILAFDFGTKSIGVAVGQELTRTAQPLTALRAKEGQPDWQQIKILLDEWRPDLIVIGLPLNMDGSEQAFTEQTRKFAQRLHGRFGIQIQLQDERLSTVEAKSLLFEQGGFKSLNKGKIDSAAAKIILESWFSTQK